MIRTKQFSFSKITIFTMLSLGIVLMGVSAFYTSSFLAILSMAIIFWGVIFLYITPSKQISLKLLNSCTEAVQANTERLILELNITGTGVYLPPKNLKNIEASLIFIPETPETPLPTPEEINEKLLTNRKTSALITAPGSALSHLFEEELGFSFTKTDLKQIKDKLPKLLVDGLELAENVEIQIQGKKVEVEITGSILDEICRQTDSYPRAHKQVGCILSSAIACALAKASGKPVIIQNEKPDQETRTTKIEYQLI